MTSNPELKIENNASALLAELQWLNEVLQTRFNLYFNNETPYSSIYDVPIPELDQNKSVYSDIVQYYKMSLEERLVMLLALSPHVCPQILDTFFTKNEKYGRGFTEFGGVKGNQHSGFIPTGETAAFLIAGNDILTRLKMHHIFEQDHYFAKYKILSLDRERTTEPLLSGVLNISKDYLSYFTNGNQYRPSFSTEFPAQQISTTLEWEDLVVEEYLLDEIQY